MSDKPGIFKKGDPRINRHGRPKTFDELRALAQEIAHEEAISGGQTIVINGHKATSAEVVLRQWLQSGNFQKQQAFMWYAFGKVPDQIDAKVINQTWKEFIEGSVNATNSDTGNQ